MSSRFVHVPVPVTCIDSSQEMLRLNREKVDDPKVRFIDADIFQWEPDATYDTIVFTNWLSHVPPTHFERFWALVERALAPGGRVFFVDEGVDGPGLGDRGPQHRVVLVGRRQALG